MLDCFTYGTIQIAESRTRLSELARQLTLTSMNCVLYARVSTDRQADLSIPAQLEAMRAYAHQRTWEVAEEFVEPGASAKTTERPALQQLLARIRNTKLRTHVVLVHKIDRLARNVYDHATIKALLKQHGIQLASVVENVDDSVPGQLVENIMASIAQFYSANLSEEVKKGMRQKLLRGGWPHLPPRGYVSVKNPDGRGSHVEVHPRYGFLVTRAFTLYASGQYGLRALAVRLAQDGLTAKSGLPVPISEVRRLLANPFYVGRVVSKDTDAPGAHEALVSPEVFKQVQEMLTRRHRDAGIKGTIKGFVLRGVAICSQCRGRMTAEHHGVGSDYYRCSRQSYKKEKCTARYCNAKQAHADIERICRGLHLRREMLKAIQQATEQEIARRSSTHEQRLDALREEQTALHQQELGLTEQFSRGTLKPVSYRARALHLQERQEEIDRILTRPPIDDQQLVVRVKKTLELATSLGDIYDRLDDIRRQQLVAVVFRTIVLSAEGVLGYALNPPFDKLAKITRSNAEQVAKQLVDTLEAA